MRRQTTILAGLVWAVLLGAVLVSVASAGARPLQGPLVSDGLAGLALPANEYRISATGDHDWVPASGGTASTSSTSVAATGTMADANGRNPYSVQSGPGVVRAGQLGAFRNPGGLTLRFNPALRSSLTEYLTVTGPGSAVSASLSVHVDGTFSNECSFDICDTYLDIQAGLDSQGARTIVRRNQGVETNTLGLTIDPIPGGYHVYGDVQMPPVTVNVGSPIAASRALTIHAGNLGDGFEKVVSWDADFEVSFSPDGPVLNLPAGYTASGENVVDNRWTDPFPQASVAGRMVYDVDRDDVRDVSEPGLDGVMSVEVV